jgi:hypothetical protein
MNVATNPRRRWFQFNMRAMLILVVFFGIGMTFVARWHDRARRQRDAVAALSSNPGNVIGYERTLEPENDPPPVPKWLRGLLDFDHFYNVVNVDLDEATDDQLRLLKDFPNLESLCLWRGSEVTEVGLGQIQSLKNLKQLTLLEMPALTDRVMALIGPIKGLRDLQLECGIKVTDAGLAELTGLSNLKSLTLKCGLQISDIGLAHIGKLSKLESLGLDLDDASIATIDLANSPNSSVASDRSTRGRALVSLGQLKRLKSLAVNGNAALMDDALSRLHEIHDLETLAIRAKDGVTDSTLAHLGKLTSLEMLRLDCGSGNETDKGMASLSGLLNLKKLEVRVGPNVSDVGLASLNACPCLSRLKLHLNDHVTGDGLAKLERLRYLELDYKTRTQDAPPSRLRVSTNVQDLVIHGSTGLADEDLAGLEGLADLRRLDLFYCEHLTNKGLWHLRLLPQLRELGVYWCVQTYDGDLRDSLPNCKITMERGGGSFGFWSRF